MSAGFRIPSFPDINLQDVTALTADALAAQAIINVLGVQGMNANDLGLVGQPGSLIGEIHEILSITNTAITFTGNLINAHRQTEQFTTLFGDQIKCYRVLNTNNYPPSDTVFAANPLGGVNPFDIDQDSPITFFTDLSGSNQYWYKFVYYNSVTGAETALSASLPVRGGPNHYCSIEDVRREAGLLQNSQIQDTQVAVRRDQAESEVDGALLASGYTLPMVDAQGNPFIPPIISNVTRLIAAGYVLLQDYGPVSAGDTKDGDSKLKAGLGIIDEIQKHLIVLVDSNKQEMATNSRIRGAVTDQTSFIGNDILAGRPPEPPLFTISRIF